MKTKILLLVLLFISTFDILVAQEKIYVPNFDTEGCKRQNGNSAAYILADFINKNGAFEAIISPNRDTNNPAETFNDARESAELNSTKYFVIGKLIKLDKMFYMSINLYSTSNGVRFWSTDRRTDSADDLIKVLEDVSRKIGSEDPRSNGGDLNLVSSYDAQKITRVKANRSLGFITGAMLPLSENKINHINTGFGGLMAFDLRNIIFEAAAEIYFAKDSLYDGYSYDKVSNNYYNLTINALYPFTTKNNAPFVCLGSGFSYKESEVHYYPVFPGSPESGKFYDSGLMLNGGGGYILKRNSDAPLFVYARGYVWMDHFDSFTYGVMLNFAIHLEGWK